MIDLTDPAIPRLVVTGHPNHELAIFGFVQRMRPRLLLLTDGGGEARVEESRRALASIGMLERTTFLNWTEQSLYNALLATDVDVLQHLVNDVRRELLAHAPRQVFCESVELYNPLHDITLPIVRAAAAGLDVELVEFALIAQEPSAGERYRVQRFPPTRATTLLHLEPAELARKLHARSHDYPSLRRSTGAVIDAVSIENAATESFAPAIAALPESGVDHVLRYEWRARLLRERGEIEREITFADHFVRAVQALS